MYTFNQVKHLKIHSVSHNLFNTHNSFFKKVKIVHYLLNAHKHTYGELNTPLHQECVI